MKLTNMKVSPEMLVLARIADNTALSVYAKTKDAQHNRNRPKSLVKALTKDEKDKPKEFKNGNEFLEEWERLVNG